MLGNSSSIIFLDKVPERGKRHSSDGSIDVGMERGLSARCMPQACRGAIRTNSTLSKYYLLALGIYCCAACQKDGSSTSEEIDYQYHAHIQRPLPNQKSLGDTIAIQVSFESHAGRPVHHISVQIYETLSEKIVYDQPAISATGVKEIAYDFKDSFVLNQENGVEGNRDWTIEARVWGKQEGVGEISQQVQFRVAP